MGKKDQARKRRRARRRLVKQFDGTEQRLCQERARKNPGPLSPQQGRVKGEFLDYISRCNPNEIDEAETTYFAANTRGALNITTSVLMQFAYMTAKSHRTEQRQLLTSETLIKQLHDLRKIMFRCSRVAATPEIIRKFKRARHFVGCRLTKDGLVTGGPVLRLELMDDGCTKLMLTGAASRHGQQAGPCTRSHSAHSGWYHPRRSDGSEYSPSDSESDRNSSVTPSTRRTRGSMTTGELIELDHRGQAKTQSTSRSQKISDPPANTSRSPSQDPTAAAESTLIPYEYLARPELQSFMDMPLPSGLSLCPQGLIIPPEVQAEPVVQAILDFMRSRSPTAETIKLETVGW